MFADVKAKYIIAIQPLALTAMIGLNFERWKFTDTLISHKYPQSSTTNLDNYIGKNTVKYELSYLYPLIGLEMSYSFLDMAYATLFFEYGFMVSATSSDTHTVRNVIFNDTMGPGNRISTGVALGYTLAFVTFELGFDYQKLFETQGYTIAPTSNKYKVLDNRAGTAFDMYTISASIILAVY